MKTFTYLVIATIFSSAMACESDLLDPRHLPEDGRAKDGVADYKLNTKLMMELLGAVRAREELPASFRAEVIPAAWPLSAVSSVYITGVFHAPHRLAHRLARIRVDRTLTSCRVRVRADEVWERDVPPGDFLRIFPWRGPDSGLLTTLITGIQDNAELQGWTLVDPGGAPI